jgi:2-polyprenyl-6-methoxyphenol hydroxylase-like FAD-dependent oxidoreductase
VMAGVLLARAGVSVLVLEKHGDFLRDFRGDTVHPSTLDVLGELGWLTDFLKRPHQELRQIGAHIGDRDIRLADLSHVSARNHRVVLMPQWDFLDFLIEKSRAFSTFDHWMNADATQLLLDEAGRVVGVGGEHGGHPFEVRADLVIAADGRHSVLRERAGLRVRDLAAPIDVLWLRLPKHPGDPPQSLGWVTTGRFVVLIDRGDYWQIAWLIEKDSFDAVKARGLASFREELAAAVGFLGDRAGEVRSFDDLKLLSVKVDRLERWWRPGMLCIGDAAHAMSPVGGVGINLAIQDAVAAANLLAAPLRNRTLADADLARVQRRREMPTRATQAVQVMIQDRVIGPVLHGKAPHVGFALRALDRWPLLQRIPAHIVGVGFRPEHVASVGASGA